MSIHERFRILLPTDKPILFFCIGTDRSTGDCLGPLVGDQLHKKGFNVLGTIDNPVHAENLQDYLKIVRVIYDDHFIVAVDASLGKKEQVGRISVRDGPLRPGAGIRKVLPIVGDIHITGVVNISGYMEFFVLQSTKLSLVMRMANSIVQAVEEVLRE